MHSFHGSQLSSSARKQNLKKLSKSFDCEVKRAFVRISDEVVEAFNIFARTLEDHHREIRRKELKRKPISERKQKKKVQRVNKCSTPKKEESAFECKYCSKSFKTLHGMKIHVGRIHKTIASIVNIDQFHFNFF